METQKQIVQITPLDLRARLRVYWQLIKCLQTGLLLITGLAGHMSAHCPFSTCSDLPVMLVTLFLAISGSTILNMVYDREIDAKMKRTANRPIPSGQVSAREALLVGLVLSCLGVGGAFVLFPLYGLIVFAGLFFDVVVYTIWLKRRSSWSIIWGGVAGGMPILAGRTLGTGQIDPVGILLALAVLLWIPTHIMTYGIKHADDYKHAGVPTFANTYGQPITRMIISFSTSTSVLMMAVAAWQIELSAGCLHATISLGVGLIGLTLASLVFPSPRLNIGVFKFASLYMLGSMGLIIVGV